MNEHEAGRIAAAMHQLRPDWPASSVLTLIRKNLMDRPRRDVTVALGWIACEENSHTPARVLETGPWWRAAGVEGGTTKPAKVDASERCSICSLSEPACRIRWAHDHDFESTAQAAQRRSAAQPQNVAAAVAALKDEIRHTEPRPDAPHGLEDYADRKPELRARVDALRERLPKDQPMREESEQG